MPLSYLHDDYHKQAVTHIRESRRFKSMYTLQEKTRPTRHVRFPLQYTHARHTLSVSSPHTWQPFTGSHEVEIDPYTYPPKNLPARIFVFTQGVGSAAASGSWFLLILFRSGPGARPGSGRSPGREVSLPLMVFLPWWSCQFFAAILPPALVHHSSQCRSLFLSLGHVQ
jgi:hypothetical protein